MPGVRSSENLHLSPNAYQVIRARCGIFGNARLHREQLAVLGITMP